MSENDPSAERPKVYYIDEHRAQPETLEGRLAKMSVLELELYWRQVGDDFDRRMAEIVRLMDLRDQIQAHLDARPPEDYEL